MELRVLGPLEAIDGTTSLPLGGRKQRALLARLALEANRTVPVARLVDDLWGDAVPESAVKMVQIYVSQLRKVLPEGLLRTRAPGYVLEIEPEAVDVTRFARLRAEGRDALQAGEAERAAGRLREALALWRGPALAEFDEPFARAEAAHLEELRLVCLEERIEADLAHGLSADVIGELEALVAHHPLREPLHRQLTLALYRSGRQAEALAAYERFRQQLDDGLGIEPSPAMKALQHAILNQDPRLELRQPARRPQPARVRALDRFVGRTAELAQLEAALDAALAGAGGTAIVSGRAGIGKTRLAAELSAHARGRGAAVLSGRCIQLVGSGLPYLPFVEALRPVRDLPALAGELRELPRLIPDLGEGAASAGASRADARLALFQEVLAVLGRLAEREPLLLVLEDLQWADESTLDLVAYLAQAVARHRILLVVTYRSDEVRPGNPLYSVATGLATAGIARSLTLEPLSPTEIEALIGEAPVSAETAAAIAARSEGNPFFVRELLAAARGETALPPVLRDVLLGHIARVGPDGGSVLRVAAAAGRDVTYGLLAAVVPLGELDLAAALREATEHDILEPNQVAGAFRFRHALFAEALYGTLLPGEREVLHERLARTLADRPALAASGAAAAETAQHWAAAGRPVEALGASLQAAKEAEAVSGLTEALHHLERVLALWERVPTAERLSGVALPSVVAWAAELAGQPEQPGPELDARVVLGFLGSDAQRVDTVARRLGVSDDAAAEALDDLEREGLVVKRRDGAYLAAPLAVAEARRLYPSVVVLESLAVRTMPPLEPDALDALRAANARLRAAAGDPGAAIAADDDFHRTLTAGCGNEHLLAALGPIRRALLRYERVYMHEPVHVARSAAQHDAIVESLARGDHAQAAQRVQENLSYGLPDLTEALER